MRGDVFSVTVFRLRFSACRCCRSLPRRGELRVFLQNNGTETQTVENGERIAQLVITPCLDIEIEETDELSETLRGAAGFGSTGTL